MSIVAGIDEAGYGPTLGPLVVTAAAFEGSRGLDDLWDLLSGAVQHSSLRSDPRLAVRDSKKVYASGRGLGRLEETVLAFTDALSGRCTGPRDLLEACAPQALVREKQCPWYEEDQSAEPLCTSHDRLDKASNTLKDCLATAGLDMLLARPQIVFAPEFNRHIRRLRNKAAVSFAHCVALLRHIFDLCHETSATVFVDKQGGRKKYGYLLLRAFPHQSIRILREGPEESTYRMTGERGELTVTFAQGCEEKQLPVALASMYSKYVRELYVARLNRFWQHHVPDLKATAGYPQDAKRFLQDIGPVCDELGIAQDKLVRAR